MKRFCFTLMAVLAVLTASADAPNGSGTYYQAANGKKGAALKSALRDIVLTTVERNYDDLWTDFRTTDKRSDGKVWDMYSSITNFTFGTDQAGNYQKEGDVYNREHSFPKSWFGGEIKPMYTDLHHMYPTDGYVNNRRGNLPFGTTNGETYKSSGGFSKVGACTYNGYTGEVFEPNDEYKGDLARTYFYMVTRYEEKLADWYNNNSESRATLDGSAYPAFQTWQLNMLLKWAAKDPVSAKETARNNAVYGIQQNRNPFIDYPGLEQYIWGSKTDVAFSYDNYVQPDGSSSGSGSGGDEPDPGLAAGTYKLQQVTSVEAGEKYVFEQGGYVMNNTCSSSALQTTNSYNTTGLTGTETYVWTLESATNGYYMKNANGTGNFPYLNSSSTSVAFDTKSSVWAFNFQPDNTVLIQCTNNSNRFLGYTSASSHAYKAYATSNLNTYPHAIKVYKLVEEITPSLTPSDLALTGAPVALSFDLYNDSGAKTINYTTSSTGAVTISESEYVSTSVSGNTITVTPVKETPSAQTITVSQAADGTHEAGSVTFTVTVSDSTPVASNGWVETSIADLTASDVFVIVGVNSQSQSFALPHDGSSNPVATQVEVSGDKITSEVTNNLMWNISGSASEGYTFYPNGETAKWLCCNTTAESGSNTSNKSIRIGTGDRKFFEMKDGHLVTKDSYTARYLAVYSGTDWRGYINTIIAPTTIKFYKQVALPSQTVSVGDTGYATMVADANLVIPSGVQAFAVQVKPGYASAFLVPVTDGIPQGAAVVIKASEGTYNFLYTSNQVDAIEENDLVPATMAVTADGSQYCLAYKNNTVGFYRVKAGITIPAGKAYLEVATASGGEAPEFYGFSDEDDATAISDELRVKSEEMEGAAYNLAGQRVDNSKLPHGIYIKNGRKVLK